MIQRPYETIWDVVADNFTPRKIGIALLCAGGPTAIIIGVGIVLKTVFGVDCIGPGCS